MRKIIVAGNWKMNKTPKEAVKLAEMFRDKINGGCADVVLCVPAIDIVSVSEVINNSSIALGAQNVFYEEKGAYTGEISPSMLKECGVEYVIVGHSERREYFGETDAIVNKKVKKILEHNMIPIMCCGETLAQREEGITLSLIKEQITLGLNEISSDDVLKIVIAYEPIWAIGTGKTATSDQAQEVCKSIRTVLKELYSLEVSKKIRIQYGGSVNGENALELFGKPDIDGGLVGGASLGEDFIKIVASSN